MSDTSRSGCGTLGMRFEKVRTWQLGVIERGSAAWDAAWAGLRDEIRARGLGDGTDAVQQHPASLETWQYMCSATEGERVRHGFRHRDHPVAGGRVYLNVYTPGQAIA